MKTIRIRLLAAIVFGQALAALIMHSLGVVRFETFTAAAWFPVWIFMAAWLLSDSPNDKRP